MSHLAVGKTTTIELMAANQIDDQGDNKAEQHEIDDQGRRFRINAEDERKAADQLHKGDRNGHQVDQNRRKQIIAIDDFGEIRRRGNFVETGINKGQPENPAGRQFHPAIGDDESEQLTQPDILSLSKPETRR